MLDEGVGTLVYDLKENRVLSFVPQKNSERQSLLIQRGADGETFFTFDTQSDGMSYIVERDAKGDIVSKWETEIPKPHYPMLAMTLSPDQKNVAFITQATPPSADISEEPWRTKFHVSPPDTEDVVRIATKKGCLLKTLNEKPKGVGGLNKGIYWLSNETIITTSHLWRDRSDQIIRYDLITEEEKTVDYSFGWALTSNYLLPSPDNRHVLLLRKSKSHVDILDPWTMTLVDEVQVTETVRRYANIRSAWINNEEFLSWDSYSNKIIRYNISTRKSTLVKPGFPSSKYEISTFSGDYFILRNDKSSGKWSYNSKTGALKKIASYAAGCIYPLNDNIILLDRAIRP